MMFPCGRPAGDPRKIHGREWEGERRGNLKNSTIIKIPLPNTLPERSPQTSKIFQVFQKGGREKAYPGPPRREGERNRVQRSCFLSIGHFAVWHLVGIKNYYAALQAT